MDHFDSKLRICWTKVCYRIEKLFQSSNEHFSLSRRGDDEDRIRMAIKRFMSKQRKKIDAVGGIKFTVGQKETNDFRQRNNLDKENGRIHYEKYIEIGFHDQVILWIHMVDVDESESTCLTDAVIVPRNHVSRDLIHQGYMLLASHDLLPCAIFGKKDPMKESVISQIYLSLGNKDEEMVASTHVAISGCLSSYGLAKGRLWTLHLSRDEKDIFVGSLKSRDEFLEYRNNMSSNPVERSLQEFMSTKSRAMQGSRSVERMETANIEHHLIPYAVSFVCMNEEDIISCEATFKVIDKNSDGVITISELLKYIKGSKSLEKVVYKIFTLPMELSVKVNVDQGWTFELVLNAICVFAMFGEQEILQMIFEMYDDYGTGRMDQNNLMDLTILMHPRRKDIMIKFIQTVFPTDVQYFTFEDIAKMNEEYPQLLFPVFQLQYKLQNAFLGLQWWDRKKRTFRQMLEKLEREANNL